MSNHSWKSLLVSPALFSATLAISAVTAGVATASEVKSDAPSVASLEQVKAYGSEGTATEAGQVTSVSQLSDVRPTDWAFQALQSLVERYGCIAGYPDRTYRGNRAMTRYEFAAGLNACLDRVNELIAAATANLVKKEDLATLQKLQEEFAAELATLRGRVDSLEARTTTLEKQQFSTTTKLQGEAIFSLSGALGDDKAIATPATGARATTSAGVDDNTTFSNRVRLSLRTSFTGKDTLLTRLQGRNVPNFQTATGTNMSRLSYEGSNVSGNQVAIDKLYYRFPLGEGGNITIDAAGGEFNANVNNFNPLLASDGQGTISRFGRYNPIYRQGNAAVNNGGIFSSGGAGITANFPLSSAFTLSAGYMAREAQDPASGRGLFDGSNAFLAQLGFKPAQNVDLGFTYVRAYDRAGAVQTAAGTGSALANAPFGANVSTTSDNFGVQGSFRVSQNFVVSGWGGFTKAHASRSSAEADIWNWAVTLAFPDLGGKGNMAGVVVGMPPKVTSNSTGFNRDRNSSFHVEGLYRLQLSDKVSVTPGLIVIFNPEHNNDNDTVYVGTIRTTFTF
jgi:hypothetical protein